VEYEGRLVCVLLIENMTGRKLAEAALRESEERYRGIVNSVQDAILLEDHTGRILDANAGAVSMYGYSRDELLSKSVHELCAPDSIYVLARSPQELLKRAPSQPLEGTNLRASGQAFPVEVCVRPHTLRGQTVSLVVVRDITRRKQAEQAASAAHQKIDQLMVSIPDVLWSAETNRSGQFWFCYVSPVIQKISGYPANTFLEQPERWLEMIHPDDREAVRAELRRFIAGSQPALELEYRLQRADGSIRYVRDRQSARQTPTGKQIDGDDFGSGFS
jgi:PAS domain S-box-containing protein